MFACMKGKSVSSLEKNNPTKKKSKVIPKNNLRKIRILKDPKISQWVLAFKTGVPQSRISLIENILVKPSVQECQEISSALNTPSKDLFPNNNLEIPFQNKQVQSQEPYG